MRDYNKFAGDVQNRAPIISWYFSESASPIIRCAPWILVAIAFHYVLKTDQVAALVASIRNHPAPVLPALILLTLAWLITLGGIIVVLVSATPEASVPRGERRAQSVARLASSSLCALLIPVWMPAEFCLATHSVVLIVSTAGLFIASASFLLYGLRRYSFGSVRSSRLFKWIALKRTLMVVGALTLAIAPLLTGAMIAENNPMALAGLGPVLVTLIGLAALSTFFGTLLVGIPLATRRPYIGVAIGIFMIVMIAGGHSERIEADNILLREKVRNAYAAHKGDEKCRRLASDLSSAVEDRVEHAQHLSSSDKAERITLVSAEGGGIRAAYWTAMMLSEMDVATNGRFSPRVFTLSGVSGGSLGVASWLAASELKDLSPSDKRKVLSKFLSSDFLSPVIEGFFFLDIPRAVLGRLWPKASRAQVFESALASQWQAIGGTDFFYRPIRALCVRTNGLPPAVFLNATDVLSGTFFSVTPTGLETGQEDPGVRPPETLAAFTSSSIDDASLAQAVHISARFPYLAPAAPIGVGEGGDPSDDFAPFSSKLNESHWVHARVLVDGGYFDNTGLSPTAVVLRELRRQRQELLDDADSDESRNGKAAPLRRLPLEVQVIHISNSPEAGCDALYLNATTASDTPKMQKLNGTDTCPRESQSIALNALSAPLIRALTIPLAALLSVRDTIGAATVKNTESLLHEGIWGKGKDGREFRLDRDFYHDEFLALALSNMLSLARTPVDSITKVNLERSFGLPPISNDVTPVQMVAPVVAYVRQVSGLEGAANPAEFESSLAQFADVMSKEAADIECRPSDLALNPPLGWVLDSADRRLLDCLAFREALLMGPYF